MTPHSNTSPILTTSTSHRRAIVTSLYSDDFALPVAALGQSLNANNVADRRIVMYLSDRVSPRALCIASAAGWEPHPVPYISPPNGGSGVFPRFADQFTKLNIWGFDKIGVDTVLYIDADTIVRRPINELWDLPFNFAAVPDMHGGPRGFVIGFNAGVLLLRTSTSTLEDMLSKLNTASYPREQAEQAFLNAYFAPQTLRLPYIYNGNLAIKSINPNVWSAIQSELKIVHYTILKPFWYITEDKQFSLDDGDFSHWAEKMKESLNTAGNMYGGYYREEVSWWADAWNGLVHSKRHALDACWVV